MVHCFFFLSTIIFPSKYPPGTHTPFYIILQSFSTAGIPMFPMF